MGKLAELELKKARAQTAALNAWWKQCSETVVEGYAQAHNDELTEIAIAADEHYYKVSRELDEYIQRRRELEDLELLQADDDQPAPACYGLTRGEY